MFSTLKDLFNTLENTDKKKLFYLQGLLLIAALFEVACVLVIAPFMSLVSGNINPDSIKFISLFNNYLKFNDVKDLIFITGFITLLIYILSSIFAIYTIYKVNYLGNTIGAKLSTRLFKHYLGKPFVFHTQNNSSDLTSKISFDAERTNTIILKVLSTNYSLIKALAIIFALIIYNFKVALILGITFIATYTFIFFALQAKYDKIGQTLSIEQSKIYKLMSEGFGSIKYIIILAKKNFFITRFQNSKNIMADKNAFVTTMSLTPRHLIETVALGGILILILYFTKTSDKDITTILSTLAVFGLGTYKLLPTFQDIYFNFSSIKTNLPAYQVIQKNLSDTSQLKEFNYKQNNNPFKKDNIIEFDNVNFHYENANHTSLSGINLKIKSNLSIGIVGETGSGKSTFGNLLLGLLNPTTGNVKVNNVKINTPQRIEKWQENISFVPQNLFLLESSIKNNITFSLDGDEVDYKKLEKSLEISQLSNFISTLSDGYDSLVGENGIKISGGQKQRIGIARAIYNDSSLFFLDEATSALDGLTEEKIISSLKEMRNKTIFIVSHNFSTIKNCDLILYFDKGKIIKQGSYQELLEIPNFKKLSIVS